MVHGGPWGSWNTWTYRWNPDPFVAAGYAVLLPDPAISTGYGQHIRSTEAISNCGTPFTDLMALIDAAEARQDIDATKTAWPVAPTAGIWPTGLPGTPVTDSGASSPTPPCGIPPRWAKPPITQSGTGQ